MVIGGKDCKPREKQTDFHISGMLPERSLTQAKAHRRRGGDEDNE